SRRAGHHLGGHAAAGAAAGRCLHPAGRAGGRRHRGARRRRQMRALLARPAGGRPPRRRGAVRALCRGARPRHPPGPGPGSGPGSGPSPGMTRMRLLGLGLALLAILLDQISKPLLRDWLAGGSVRVTSFFNLVSAWNRGVGFSLLVMEGAAGPYILAVAALIIAGGMLVWLWRTPRWLPAAGLGLIIRGALGNVIDRLRYGAVFDFLDFHLADNHFPAFNIADSSLSVGVALLIIDGLFDGAGNSKNT